MLLNLYQLIQLRFLQRKQIGVLGRAAADEIELQSGKPVEGVVGRSHAASCSTAMGYGALRSDYSPNFGHNFGKLLLVRWHSAPTHTPYDASVLSRGFSSLQGLDFHRAVLALARSARALAKRWSTARTTDTSFGCAARGTITSSNFPQRSHISKTKHRFRDKLSC